MPKSFQFGNQRAGSSISDSGFALSGNSLGGGRRGLCLHSDFSDVVGSQPKSMARYGDESDMRNMVHMNTPLRIFIADDSPLIRNRIALMFGVSAMIIAGQAETPQDSIEGILAAYPDGGGTAGRSIGGEWGWFAGITSHSSGRTERRFRRLQPQFSSKLSQMLPWCRRRRFS